MEAEIRDEEEWLRGRKREENCVRALVGFGGGIKNRNLIILLCKFEELKKAVHGQTKRNGVRARVVKKASRSNISGKSHRKRKG